MKRFSAAMKHGYRSGLEVKVTEYLKENKIPVKYEAIKIEWEDLMYRTYTPDFVLPNGVVLECKGYWEPADRRKIRAVKELNPNLDLRMVFQAPFNKISKKSKTTYAKWCEKHDIPWTSFKDIPIDWLL